MPKFYFIHILVVILGVIIGSFMGSVIYRLPKQDTKLPKNRSGCPHCKKQLKKIDLIPVISYFILKGKCRYCKKPISIFYPGLELITGTLFLIIFIKFIPTINSLNFDNILLVLIYLFFSSILIFTFFYDLLYLEIPDKVLLPSILTAFLLSFHPYTPEPKTAIIGALIPVLFFGAQIVISNGRWIGGGDLRLGAFMGLILGWKLVLVALILSYLLGSLYSIPLLISKKANLKTQVPFGPFLVLGTFLTIFFGELILDWYLKITFI